MALATEEAITHALVAAETMVGRDDHRIDGLPEAEAQQILRAHGRLYERR